MRASVVASRRSFLRRVTPVLGLAVALAACGEDAAGPELSKLTVSGTLAGPGVATLPEGARVVVVWGVTSTSPDYSYVFGGGTIDRATGRFSVTLPDRPPQEALNLVDGYGLGVGTLMLVGPDVTLGTGRIESGELPMGEVLGAAGQHAILFTAGDPATSPLTWARAFPRGYGVGRGIEQPGLFDGFEPIAADGVTIIVDDVANIDFVNWT